MTILVGYQGVDYAVFAADRLADGFFGKTDMDKIYNSKDNWLFALTGCLTPETLSKFSKRGSKLKKKFFLRDKKLERRVEGVMIADLEKIQLYGALASVEKYLEVLSFTGIYSIKPTALEPNEVTVSGHIIGPTVDSYYPEINQYRDMMRHVCNSIDAANITEEYITIMSSKMPKFIGGSEVYIMDSGGLHLQSKKKVPKEQQAGLFSVF